jgi:hypothetical protein
MSYDAPAPAPGFQSYTSTQRGAVLYMGALLGPGLLLLPLPRRC